MRWLEKTIPLAVMQWCIWGSLALFGEVALRTLLIAAGGAILGASLAFALGKLFEEKVEE